MSVEVQDRFKSCLSFSNKKGCPPSINDGLEIYGLLKQATRGDNYKSRPSAFNIVERAKWDAWTKKKGIGQDEAMLQFIALVRTAHQCNC